MLSALATIAGEQSQDQIREGVEIASANLDEMLVTDSQQPETLPPARWSP